MKTQINADRVSSAVMLGTTDRMILEVQIDDGAVADRIIHLMQELAKVLSATECTVISFTNTVD